MFVNEKMFGMILDDGGGLSACYIINLTKYIAGRMYVKLQIGRVWLLDRYWKSWLSHLPLERLRLTCDHVWNIHLIRAHMNIRVLVSEWLWEKLCVFQIEEDFMGQNLDFLVCVQTFRAMSSLLFTLERIIVFV